MRVPKVRSYGAQPPMRAPKAQLYGIHPSLHDSTGILLVTNKIHIAQLELDTLC